MDGPVLGRLDPRNDSAGLLGRDVVHGLLVATSTKWTEGKVSLICILQFYVQHEILEPSDRPTFKFVKEALWTFLQKGQN